MNTEKEKSIYKITCPHCNTVYSVIDYDKLYSDEANFKVCSHCYGSFRVTIYVEGAGSETGPVRKLVEW